MPSPDLKRKILQSLSIAAGLSLPPKINAGTYPDKGPKIPKNPLADRLHAPVVHLTPLEAYRAQESAGPGATVLEVLRNLTMAHVIRHPDIPADKKAEACESVMERYRSGKMLAGSLARTVASVASSYLLWAELERFKEEMPLMEMKNPIETMPFGAPDFKKDFTCHFHDETLDEWYRPSRKKIS